jgi:hypothetical protein
MPHVKTTDILTEASVIIIIASRMIPHPSPLGQCAVASAHGLQMLMPPAIAAWLAF